MPAGTSRKAPTNKGLVWGPSTWACVCCVVVMALQSVCCAPTFMATMEEPQKKNGDMRSSKLPSCSKGTSAVVPLVDGVLLLGSC